MKAIDVQIGDRIRDGVVLDKQPAWATSHGKPTGVSIRFTVRDDTFPSSPERPTVRYPQYPADMAVTIHRPKKRPDPIPETYTWVPPETARVLGFDPDTLPAMGFAGFGRGEPSGIEVQVPRSALDRYFGRA